MKDLIQGQAGLVGCIEYQEDNLDSILTMVVATCSG